ncbi:MAG: oligosaccharide flippase family protein [Pseudomonadota bacterium]
MTTRSTSRWNSYVRSTYLKPVLGLFSGQSVAAALPILAAPLLGRLYLPEDYGALGLYMGLSSVLGTFSCLQFQEAILAEKSDRRAGQILFLCLACGCLVAISAMVLSFGISLFLSVHGNFQALGVWIWLLPLSVLTTALGHSVNMYCNRIGRFNYLAIMPALITSMTVSLSILFGFWQWGENGLFSSYFAGQGVVVTGAIWMLIRLKLDRGSIQAWFALAKRHRKFVIFTLPSRFVGEFNLQIPIYALGLTGSSAVLGLFTRARALITLPLTLAGRAVGQVYRQKASEDYRETGSCRQAFERTAIGLAVLAVPSMALLAWLGPDMFALFLGPNWRGAGEIVRLLAPMLFLRMIAAPLSSTLLFTNSLGREFQLSLLSGAVLILSVLLPALLGSSPITIVTSFSAAMSVVYIVYFYASWRASGS